MLKKLYFPFLICNTAFFSLGIIFSPTLSFVSFFLSLILALTYWPQLCFSICNFLAGKNDRFNTSSGDLIIMIMTLICWIPFIGFFAKITGLVFCILNLVRYHRWKKNRNINRNIVNNDDYEVI